MNNSVKMWIYKHPQLRHLFLELTRMCNLRCKHCGSSCPTGGSSNQMQVEMIRPLIDEIAENFTPDQLMFCITGGEPLLNPDWPEITAYIRDKGFSWGMTSNGTLIDVEAVRLLHQCGMRTIGISMDGIGATHDLFRGVHGAFDKAANALRLLANSGLFESVQAITAVWPGNLGELSAMYDLLVNMGIDSWKLTGVEPIGEARNEPKLFLNTEQYKFLFDFIREKRAEASLEVTYGCAHHLPAAYDDSVRKNHFLCGAGTLIASITCEGDITACLDIGDRASAKQGNILVDKFMDVWQNKFEAYRRNKALESLHCKECDRRFVCHGDAWHTWDVKEKSPRFCLYQKLEGVNEKL